MGRKVSDGRSVDVTAPASTLIEAFEMYRVDGWTGFAADEITTTEVDRAFALIVDEGEYRVKVPAATAAARGDFLQWTTGAGFKKASTDLSAIAAPTDGSTPILAVAKVTAVRNSSGYATVKLLHF